MNGGIIYEYFADGLEAKSPRLYKRVGIPKTTFCSRIGISPSYLYKWFKGEKEFSDSLVSRINDYIDKF